MLFDIHKEQHAITRDSDTRNMIPDTYHSSSRLYQSHGGWYYSSTWEDIVTPHFPNFSSPALNERGESRVFLFWSLVSGLWYHRGHRGILLVAKPFTPRIWIYVYCICIMCCTYETPTTLLAMSSIPCINFALAAATRVFLCPKF